MKAVHYWGLQHAEIRKNRKLIIKQTPIHGSWERTSVIVGNLECCFRVMAVDSRQQELLTKVEAWKVVATEKQHFYSHILKQRRWEMFEAKHTHLIKSKIAYALYGPPINVNDTCIDNFYKFDKMIAVENILKSIKEVNNQNSIIVISIIFIIGLVENKYTEFPVFRVLSYKQEDGKEHYQFVDANGIRYINWKNLKDNNSFPNYGIYCYPKGGFYSFNETGEVDLEFKQKLPMSWIISGVSLLRFFKSLALVPLLLWPVPDKIEQSISCLSKIEGISEKTENIWFEVTSISGSADVHAVHSRADIAKSCWQNYKLPKIIKESLDYGYIKFNWYAVLNYTNKAIENSSGPTKIHAAQFISSALFFCNSITLPATSWQIIKEIKKDQENNNDVSVLSLDYRCKIALEPVLNKSKRLKANMLTGKLKFINERQEIIFEAVERKFKSLAAIPDQLGNRFIVQDFLATLNISPQEKKYSDVMTNYCLVLEEISKNCFQCNKIMESGELMELLNAQFKRAQIEEWSYVSKYEGSKPGTSIEEEMNALKSHIEKLEQEIDQQKENKTQSLKVNASCILL